MMERTADDRLRETEALLMRRILQAERDAARLRAQQRVMLGSAVAALLLAGAALAVAFARTAPSRVAEAVEARRFVLRDAAGVVRATLATRPDGAARVLLLDRGGTPRLQLSLLPDGSPGLTLSDAQGRPSAVLGQLADRTTSLVLADPAGTTRAVLGYAPADGTSLVFAAEDGSTRAWMGVDRRGEGSLTLVETASPAEPLPAPPVDPEEAGALTAPPGGGR